MPHAQVKEGDDARIAWLKERAQNNRANARITSGADCWDGVVDKYAAGG